VIYDSKGCAECAHTGYRGRRGVFEALLVTDELEELIASKSSVVDIRELALKQGMITLRESGLRIVAAGDTSIDEVLATTVGEMPTS
jgi:type IV pilus assembly protein PilB